MFKNLVILIVYVVLIKANLFTLILAKVYKLILYLLYNIIHRIVKCFLLIN
jgi:hypothetical protein